jgi:hypothetical protein
MIEIALVAQVVLWLAALWFFMANRQASIFHPVTAYLGFHALVFVLRPILASVYGFDSSWAYMQFQPSPEIFVRTLAVSSLAMICFVTTCLYVGRGVVTFGNQSAPEFTAQERSALVITTLMFLPIVAFSIYATRNGIAGQNVNGTYVMTNSTGYLNDAQHFVIPLLCAWLVVTRFHWLNLILSTLYIGYRAWFGWSRWTILLFFLMVVMAYCWYYRRKWMPVWFIALAIPVLLLFNLLGHNREALKSYFMGQGLKTVDYDAGMSASDKLKRRFDTQDYANFDFLSYVVWLVPEKSGAYSYGLQYLQLLTEPIPRILWGGKPVGPPVKTGVDLYAYANFNGLTVSMAGDGWVTGGWIGVIIVLSLSGALLGRFHCSFWKHVDERLFCILYMVGGAMVPQWYRDGGVVSIAKFLFFCLVPILTWVGVKWCLGPKMVPGYTILLPPDTRLRLLQSRERCAAKILPGER